MALIPINAALTAAEAVWLMVIALLLATIVPVLRPDPKSIPVHAVVPTFVIVMVLLLKVVV